MKLLTIFDTVCDKELTILIGDNAKENWDIIGLASQYDYWFHVKNASSCHVVLRVPSNKTKINKQTLKHCAALCKEHSKYADYKNVKILYTLIKNVSKGETIGSVYTTNDKIIIV